MAHIAVPQPLAEGEAIGRLQHIEALAEEELAHLFRRWIWPRAHGRDRRRALTGRRGGEPLGPHDPLQTRIGETWPRQSHARIVAHA